MAVGEEVVLFFFFYFSLRLRLSRMYFLCSGWKGETRRGKESLSQSGEGQHSERLKLYINR